MLKKTREEIRKVEVKVEDYKVQANIIIAELREELRNKDKERKEEIKKLREEILGEDSQTITFSGSSLSWGMPYQVISYSDTTPKNKKVSLKEKLDYMAKYFGIKYEEKNTEKKGYVKQVVEKPKSKKKK